MAELRTNNTENGASDHGEYHGHHAEGESPSALNIIQDQLTHFARTRPYTTLAVAAATGYVLGGGLPWWAIRGAATIGSRIMVARAIASVVGED